MLESISSSFTKWNKHMMDTRDYQVSFTFGPCDHQQEVSLRVHLLDFISKAVRSCILKIICFLLFVFFIQNAFLKSCISFSLLFFRASQFATHVFTTWASGPMKTQLNITGRSADELAKWMTDGWNDEMMKRRDVDWKKMWSENHSFV